MPTELLLYNIDPDHRNSLYYDQYEWCVTINISESPCLRYLDSAQFERAIQNAKHWAESNQWTDRIWTTTKEIALRETRHVLLSETKPFKTVVSFNIVNIYTNNLKLADRFKQLDNDGVLVRLVRQAVVSKPAGVIQLRKSKYAYRTYFRERKYSLDQKVHLLNFLNSRTGTLRPCDALITWLKNVVRIGYQSKYSRSYYFVDHDHPNEGTMLSLVMPGIVRKTMPIETTK
jgi:hypothetical protein